MPCGAERPLAPRGCVRYDPCIASHPENTMSRTPISRRSVLAALGLAGLSAADLRALEDAPKPKGNIKQSICRWCYGRIPLEKLCGIAKALGYQSIELLLPKEILTVKKAGLTCAVVGGAVIARGLNR